MGLGRSAGASDCQGPETLETTVTRPARTGGLLTAAILSLGPAVVLGLGRFAYALLLPDMRSDLRWSYATAGAMNTANAAGYLAGAMLAVPVSRRLGARTAFVGGMVVTAVSLGLSAATTHTVVLLAVRLGSGSAGGVTFVVGGAMAAHIGGRLPARRSAAVLGVYCAGGSLGILGSALVIPFLLSKLPAGGGWRVSWLVLASLSMLAIVGVIPTVRRARLPESFAPPGHWPAAGLVPLLACYGLYGLGYIAYMTFIVAFLGVGGEGPTTIAVFWAILGLAGIVSGFAWAPVISRLRGGRAPAFFLAAVGVGAVLPLTSSSNLAAFASAVVFGGTFFAVVTAVTVTARRSLPSQHWTGAFAGLTVAFALGQCVGPVLAGILSDRPSGVRAGLVLSVGVLGAAALIAMLHTDTRSD